MNQTLALAATAGLRSSVIVDRAKRTGRSVGIAAQSPEVHDGWIYDLEFDTTHGPDPLELAAGVLQLGAT